MSATTERERESLLRKVQGLMAKAESTQFEGERDAFFAKAEELMNKYRIELWELQQQQGGRLDARKPIVMNWDYAWAFEAGPFPAIADSLWYLFLATAQHCQCIVVTHKQHWSYDNGKGTYASHKVPVIGTEIDLRYLELLFTSLMTQLVDATHPRADIKKPYFDNLRTFREAGWNWHEVTRAMQEAGFDPELPHKKAYLKFSHDYRRLCKELGVEQDYRNWKVFRRNFADGWTRRVSTRMSDMRQTDVVSTKGMEIALREQSVINAEFANDLFPRTGTRAMVSSRDSRKFDSAAYTGGQKAGDRANISSHPSSGLKGRKGLDK